MKITKINEMNLRELQEQLKNCYDYEKTVTNNGNGWVHPATAKHARLQYEGNRKEIVILQNEIQKRLAQLAYFDED